MQVSTIPFSAMPMLAKTDRAYSTNDPLLRPFFQYSADWASFEQVIADKKRQIIDRQTLVKVLKQQYERIAPPISTLSQIEQLKENNTFTVVTAHQPSVFLGPLYFVYKIFSTIHVAKKLQSLYPDNQFIPVFVIGGEDHDFEEISEINIFNKKISWKKPLTEGGAVGMMSTASLADALDELKNILGESENSKIIFEKIATAYKNFDIYHDATQALLHSLFGEYGLLVLNMNDIELKHIFKNIIRKELTAQPSKKLVAQTQQDLQNLGFKSQAFAREINLFYMRKNLRERIVAENGIYKALNTDFSWTQSEILAELDEHPEYFSPNVVLRPLYQETILPNLAYIGGGGELAYWLERKAQFAHFGVNFPMLIRRNSFLFVDAASRNRLEKIGITLNDFLTGDTEGGAIRQFLSHQQLTETSLQNEKEMLTKLFDNILQTAKKVDATLEKTVLAEKTKQLQVIEQLENRLTRAEKQKHETTLQQIRALAQKFFPNGGLQERHDNFLPLYLRYGKSFFDTLLELADPFAPEMIVISE